MRIFNNTLNAFTGSVNVVLKVPLTLLLEDAYQIRADLKLFLGHRQKYILGHTYALPGVRVQVK
jgi:hypothetical protein